MQSAYIFTKTVVRSGFTLRNLHTGTVFQAIVLSRLLYALPAWESLITLRECALSLAAQYIVIGPVC